MNTSSGDGSAKIYVLLPGLGSEWWSGGLQVAESLARLLGEQYPCEVITYRDRTSGVRYLEDAVEHFEQQDIFIVTWGPHVPELIERLHGRRVVYYAQSFGYVSSLPPGVPILCVSRYVLSEWVRCLPQNPVFLMPPTIPNECENHYLERDVEVLIIARKSSKYLLEQLAPELGRQCRLLIQKDIVSREKIFELYNRSKVYLYSSVDLRARGLVEGFGLQPLEAVLCGCRVFSNLDGGLSDNLVPEVNMQQLGVGSLAYDEKRILRAVSEYSTNNSSAECRSLRAQYAEVAAKERISKIVPALHSFFSTHSTPSAGNFQPTSRVRAADRSPLKKLYRLATEITAALRKRS